ncbi:anhydro-N-acetylmuramic acid kinase [Leifsonia sp. NPDC058292]|uniref:anhydro-N-acetylmuramic acid kinase n=1 Tax=Leifsonia sp. NPDC058292 TaxID=3346428 RepID=UPI0036DC41A6
MRILSLQSGTSADGIDVAVADVTALDESDSPVVGMQPVLARTVPWSPPLRERLLAAVAGEALTPAEFCELDTLAGQEFAAVAVAAADAARPGSGSAAGGIDLAVSHGQTLYHWVADGHARGTLQIGEPAWISEALDRPVLSNLRSADIAAGGEGAPLMGLFDRAWLAGEAESSGRPVATVNLGGIANVQIVSPGGGLVAFDSGPANALIDAVVARATDGRETRDQDGALASAGRVDERVLAELLAHPYFLAAPPKSTGRETFDLAVVDRAVAAAGNAGGTSPALGDLVATLTALTARTVANAVRSATSVPPARAIVSGGGVHNPALMRALTAVLGLHGIAVGTSDEWGVPADDKESLLFALVGFLSWHGIPADLPGTPAGAARVLGRLTLTPQTTLGPRLRGISGLIVAHSTAADQTIADQTIANPQEDR